MAASFALGGLRLRNRLVAVAHGLADVHDGAPTETDARYWRRLASGGAGMIITGGTVVAPESTLRQRYLTEAYRPEVREALRYRAVAINGEGAVSIAQLVHLGRESLGAANNFVPVSASAVRSPREPVAPRALGPAEVRQVVDAFRISALNCVEAGFHGVELHAAHGYLIAQFLSPVTNTRDDAYGGDAERRTAVLREIIDAIRAEVGDRPIGVRLSIEDAADTVERGLGLGDLLDIVRFVRATSPFDYLNVTTGVRNSYVPGMATAAPPLLDSITRIRAATPVPLLVSQSFRTAADIDRALGLGADLVGMARPFIADPDVASKLLAGDERAVRPCTSCNEDCRTFEPTGLCTVNPDLAPPGEHRRPAVPLVLTRGRRAGAVAVVGAGPAGMECALTLAGHGTPVTVFEVSPRVGGQAHLASLAPRRQGWQRFVDYQHDQLTDLGVRVVLGSPSPSGLPEFGDVVLATGATERPPDVTGALPAVSTTEFLRRPGLAGAGMRIAVLDDGFGWWPGIGAVQTAIERGAAEIVMVTPGAGFAASLSLENRTQLVHRLAGAPLRVLPFSTVTGTLPAAVQVRNTLDGSDTEVAADLLVVAGERIPRLPGFAAAPGQTVVAIGDCVVPRRMSHAVSEGRATARMILDQRLVRS